MERNQIEQEEIIKNVYYILEQSKREGAFDILSKHKDKYDELAVHLWQTRGVVAILIQEIISIYPMLNNTNNVLELKESNRVCNVLSILQCIAQNRDTRNEFLAAHIPLQLQPFLNTQCKSKPQEYLRLTSLGVIGALVKTDDSEVVTFLLQTEIIPLCLRIMERGSDLSKTVATFIVQKILQDDNGLEYICQTAQRFQAVCMVLNTMIENLSPGSSRLFKHIIRCQLRLSENKRARDALKRQLPTNFKKPEFVDQQEDLNIKKQIQNLIQNIESTDK